MNQAKTSEVSVESLHVYPLKSCKGIDLSEAELTPQGFPHDRQWMIVAENGRALTQREIPLMSQVETALEGGDLILSRAGYGGISIPLEHSAPPGSEELITVKLWRDEIQTVLAGAEASRWVSEALQSDKPLRIVRIAPGFERPQSNPDELGADTRIQFADAAPYLFIDKASLQQLNQVLEEKGEDAVPMNRFRPNVVIQGLKPFSEHDLNFLGNDKAGFDFRIPCERCVVPTIEQSTSVRHPRKEPFATLRDVNPLDPKRRQPLFGQYATLHGSGGRIAAGDRLSGH